VDGRNLNFARGGEQQKNRWITTSTHLNNGFELINSYTIGRQGTMSLAKALFQMKILVHCIKRQSVHQPLTSYTGKSMWIRKDCVCTELGLRLGGGAWSFTFVKVSPIILTNNQTCQRNLDLSLFLLNNITYWLSKTGQLTSEALVYSLFKWRENKN